MPQPLHPAQGVSGRIVLPGMTRLRSGRWKQDTQAVAAVPVLCVGRTVIPPLFWTVPGGSRGPAPRCRVSSRLGLCFGRFSWTTNTRVDVSSSKACSWPDWRFLFWYERPQPSLRSPRCSIRITPTVRRPAQSASTICQPPYRGNHAGARRWQAGSLPRATVSSLHRGHDENPAAVSAHRKLWLCLRVAGVSVLEHGASGRQDTSLH